MLALWLLCGSACLLLLLLLLLLRAAPLLCQLLIRVVARLRALALSVQDTLRLQFCLGSGLAEASVPDAH